MLVTERVILSVFPCGEAIHNPPPAGLPIQTRPSFCAWMPKFSSPGLGRAGRKEGSREVVQAMIRAHPDAPVALVLKDGPHGVGGQAIALGKPFHLPFRMTRAKGIAKCG